jgi:uncharacterized protein
MAKKKYHILSLDGGGSWALIQVRVLIDLFGANASGHTVLKNFDLVAANSGGSIVAAGLIENYTLTEILNFFLDANIRKSIFSQLPWYQKLNPVRWVLPSPQFSTDQKLIGLKNVLKTNGLQALTSINIAGKNGEAVKFIFTAYDYDRDRAKFFRSWNSKTGSLSPSSSVNLVDAIHASTNAPVTFFDKPTQIQDKRFWDGGLTGYNNPVLAATVEAIGENWPRSQIAALSIGTASTMLPIAPEGEQNNPLLKLRSIVSTIKDVEKLATTVLADPPDAHTFIAHLMLNGGLPEDGENLPYTNTSVFRLNPLIQPAGSQETGWRCPEGFTLDEFKQLIDLDMAAIKDEEVALIVRLCEAWMSGRLNNQPIRPSKTLECEIGFANYPAAKAAWLAV